MAGASALREYERREELRTEHARKSLGRVGVALTRVIGPAQSTKAWEQGGRAEVKSGERFAKHLEGTGVRVLHDRRVPGHGRANIDHLLVGPAGVMVIDTKDVRGKIKIARRGGLFSSEELLLINGRNRTNLVDGLERQVGYVRDALAAAGSQDVPLEGALCFPNPDGLPLFGSLRIRGVLIDGPKPISRRARRDGPLDAERLNLVWQQLGRAFPPA